MQKKGEEKKKGIHMIQIHYEFFNLKYFPKRQALFKCMVCNLKTRQTELYVICVHKCIFLITDICIYTWFHFK